MDFVASMPGSKSRYSGARRANRARFIPALTNSSICAGTRCSRPRSRSERLLKATPREVVANAEAVEIKIQNALLVGVARIAHPNMRVEASGSLCQGFVDGFRVVRGGDRNDIGVGRAA